MASTYSPILRTELIGSGDQAGTWGTTTNNNFQYIFEQAIAGYQVITITPTTNNQVLTFTDGPSAVPASDQSIYAILKLDAGTVSANFNIYAPPASKTYFIWNNSGYTATFYNSTVIGNTTAAGTGVAIPTGRRAYIISTGVDFYDAINYLSGNLSVAGNANITGTAAVTGNTTLSGTLNVTGAISGPGTGLTGTAAALSIGGNAATATLASTVTTNANLTGPITSVGNATSIASQTGTGTTFVVANTPTITTPALTNPTVTNYVETLFSATGNTTVSLANGTVQKITTSGSTTITLPASVTGKSFTIIVVYAGTNPITFAGGSTIKWANSITPVGTAIAGKIDIFNFYQDGTNTYGAIYGQNF
jgi:hypothetical protein